jgi:pilus assembly protein Flp/PilA
MKSYELWLRVPTRSQGSAHLGRELGGPRRSERGASAVEYGLLIAGIAAMIVVVVFAFGGGTTGLFHGSCSTILEATSAGDCS